MLTLLPSELGEAMSVDAVILQLAEPQLGLVTLEQLLAADITRKQVFHRLRSGVLVGVYPCVYRTACAPASLAQEGLAGCLVGGPEAFASGLTALSLLEIAVVDGRPIEITVAGDRRVRVEGLIAHRSEIVGPRERMRCEAVPVSTAARSIIDTAGQVERDDLEGVVDRAIRRRLLTPGVLLTESSRPVFSNRPRIGVVQRLARDRAEGVPESELEARMYRLIRKFGLPGPARQYEVVARGRSVRFDLAYPSARLAIELDGRAPHYGRDRWQRDHDRHNAAELSGWRTLRFTWLDVTERPTTVVVTIAEALDIRPARWRPLSRTQ